MSTPEPKVINIQRIILNSGIVFGISLFLATIISFINEFIAALLIKIGFFSILTYGIITAVKERRSFLVRKAQHEEYQRRYLWQLEQYSSKLALFEKEQAEYPIKLKQYKNLFIIWEQQIHNPQYQLQSILTNSITYEGIKSDARRGNSEVKFEESLRNYFGDKIKVGVWIQNPNYDDGYHYTPDFAYIDELINLHIDIEIDEPYAYNKKPIHYLGYNNETKRNNFFLDCLWVVIRFSEEQVILYPKSCCKEIAQVIFQITGERTILSKFEQVENLQPIDRWTYQEGNCSPEDDLQ